MDYILALAPLALQTAQFMQGRSESKTAQQNREADRALDERQIKLMEDQYNTQQARYNAPLGANPALQQLMAPLLMEQGPMPGGQAPLGSPEASFGGAAAQMYGPDFARMLAPSTKAGELETLFQQFAGLQGLEGAKADRSLRERGMVQERELKESELAALLERQRMGDANDIQVALINAMGRGGSGMTGKGLALSDAENQRKFFERMAEIMGSIPKMRKPGAGSDNAMDVLTAKSYNPMEIYTAVLPQLSALLSTYDPSGVDMKRQVLGAMSPLLTIGDVTAAEGFDPKLYQGILNQLLEASSPYGLGGSDFPLFTSVLDAIAQAEAAAKLPPEKAPIAKFGDYLGDTVKYDAMRLGQIGNAAVNAYPNMASSVGQGIIDLGKYFTRPTGWEGMSEEEKTAAQLQDWMSLLGASK